MAVIVITSKNDFDIIRILMLIMMLMMMMMVIVMMILIMARLYLSMPPRMMIMGRKIIVLYSIFCGITNQYRTSQ